jgi:DNA replicative helicase MCM subunit Mcm2 (Cdc46/Mcm family)
MVTPYETTANGNTDDPITVYKVSVSQASRLHSGKVEVEGIISGISKLKKIIKEQNFICLHCGKKITLTPRIKFEDEKPNLYSHALEAPEKCDQCKEGRFIARNEYINAIVIELRDVETFSDIDPLKVVVFDHDTIDVHTHLGEKVSINGNIRIISFPRKDTVSYLYAETIAYESSQEIVITAYDKAAVEKLVQVAKSKKMNVLDILAFMFAPDIIGNNIIKQGMLLCAASTNTDENQKKIQILVIGDPGLGKSAMLRKSIELVPNSRYESAQNSSGKSLTAIVEKDEESHILRTGPIPAAKGAICALNELGRMYFEDQKHLLDVLQEQFFTINKHGINARIDSPTAIIASANPVDGEWSDPEKINIDEIPVLKPLIDRFDLIFVTRNIRDEESVRNYANKKFDLYGRKTPNYTQYLRKYIEYSKRFDPKLSGVAEHMLKEYYISIRQEYGSPRILDSIVAIAKMIARLKLKNVIDAEDAKETEQFYNVILQQFSQMVNVVTDPSDEVFDTCIDILQGLSSSMQFEELIKIACDRNIRVKYYIGDRFKLRENKKLRSILDRLRNHSQIITMDQKPIVLKWKNMEDSSSGNDTTKCDPCDLCDLIERTPESPITTEQPNISSDIVDNTDANAVELGSHRSHMAHRAHSVDTEGFACNYCEFQTDNSVDYNKHTVNKHPKKQGYPDRNGRT